MSNVIPKVGGEVDAHCTKCELDLAHTILAMVGTTIARVRCNTCGSDRKYRGTQPAAKSNSFSAPKKSSAQKAAEAAAKVVIGFEQQLESKKVSAKKPYNVKTTFAVDDVVDHPSFGLGFVTAVRADKVDITFKSFTKTLVHGKSGEPTAKPTFQHPGRPVAAPAPQPDADGAAPNPSSPES